MGQATADATWEKVPEFKDAYPSFQLEDELFSNLGGGECCGCFHWEKISAMAQAKRSPAHSGLRKLIFEL
jgi:hypothetical protein